MAQLLQRELARKLISAQITKTSFTALKKMSGRGSVSINGNIINSPLGTIVSFQSATGSNLNGAAGAFGDALFGQLTDGSTRFGQGGAFSGEDAGGVGSGGPGSFGGTGSIGGLTGLKGFEGPEGSSGLAGSTGFGGSSDFAALAGLGNKSGSSSPMTIGKHGGGGDPAADDGGDDSSGGSGSAAPEGQGGGGGDGGDGGGGSGGAAPEGQGDGGATVSSDGTITLGTIEISGSGDDTSVVTLPEITITGDPGGSDSDTGAAGIQIGGQSPGGGGDAPGAGDGDEAAGSLAIIGAIASLVAAPEVTIPVAIGAWAGLGGGILSLQSGYEKNHPGGGGPKQLGQNPNPEGSGKGGPRQFTEMPNPETGSGSGPRSFSEMPAPDSSGKGTPRSFSLRGSAMLGGTSFRIDATVSNHGAALLFIVPVASTNRPGGLKEGIKLQIGP